MIGDAYVPAVRFCERKFEVGFDRKSRSDLLFDQPRPSDLSVPVKGHQLYCGKHNFFLFDCQLVNHREKDCPYREGGGWHVVFGNIFRWVKLHVVRIIILGFVGAIM